MLSERVIYLIVLLPICSSHVGKWVGSMCANLEGNHLKTFWFKICFIPSSGNEEYCRRFSSQHPCWSSGMKNKGCRHNFGIRPAKEYHNSRQTKEWQMLVCFLDDPLQNGCLVVIIICNQGYTATKGQNFNMGNLWENTYFSQTRISFKINCIWIIITEWPCYTAISSDGQHIRTLFNIYWTYLY
jgi:hypothetical protein